MEEEKIWHGEMAGMVMTGSGEDCGSQRRRRSGGQGQSRGGVERPNSGSWKQPLCGYSKHQELMVVRWWTA